MPTATKKGTWTQEEITITVHEPAKRNDDDVRTAWVHPACPGLALAQPFKNSKQWNVTHRQSGKSICPCDTLAVAKRAAREFVRFLDCTGSEDHLMEQARHIPKTISKIRLNARMRLTKPVPEGYENA